MGDFAKKHKKQLILASIGFAYVMMLLCILASNGNHPALTVIIFICMGYLTFHAILNRDWLKYKLFPTDDELYDQIEERRALRVYK